MSFVKYTELKSNELQVLLALLFGEQFFTYSRDPKVPLH